MSTPLVSVVIPTYKRSNLVLRAVNSVLIQSYSNYEIIIIDDNVEGSEQQKNTKRKIEKNFNDFRIQYHTNKKSLGGGGSRNEGIKKSNGEYIAFLDDDEDWLPQKLSKQIELFSGSTSEVGAIDTGFYSISEKNEKIYISPEMQGWILEDLLMKNKRAPKLSTLICKKKILETVGGFDAKLKSRQDLDLYIRLSKVCEFQSIDEPLANKRFDAAERISTNLNSKLQGYELIYEKYYKEFKLRPNIHANYLLKHSKKFIEAKKYFHAIKKIFHSFWIVKFQPQKVFVLVKKIIRKMFK